MGREFFHRWTGFPVKPPVWHPVTKRITPQKKGTRKKKHKKEGEVRSGEPTGLSKGSCDNHLKEGEVRTGTKPHTTLGFDKKQGPGKRAKEHRGK